MEFTHNFYARLIRDAASNRRVSLFQEATATSDPAARRLFVRHDVDVCLSTAIKFAEREKALGVPATYFVMLGCELYRPSHRELSRLTELGHEVGLHFDNPQELKKATSIDAVSDLVGAQRRALEDVMGTAVTSVSFHRPLPHLLRGPLMLGECVSAYAADLMKWYISDSAGRWACGNPIEEVASDRSDTLQILTHPIWWAVENGTPLERLNNLLARRTSTSVEAAELRQALKRTIPKVFEE